MTILNRIISTLIHRGPDNQYTWSDESAGIGLAFARLSILDLSPAGNQPMVSATGRFIIVFNGEIYNHLDIRKEIEQLNRPKKWHGHSDTETLLAGFETWGIETTIIKTVGMFAFGVWDRHLCKLTLGRDRIGEKPLYYGWHSDTFIFASELKAIKAHPAFISKIDRNALCDFMRLSYIPSPQSIYQGIYKLIPGTLITLSRSEKGVLPIPKPYWSLMTTARQGLRKAFSVTDNEMINFLETRLSEAVLSQQLSDVPLGLFLSGGIDSSTIAALMQVQSNCPIDTFTIGFENEHYDEAFNAKSVARHLGTNHRELYITSDQAQSIIPLLSTIYDEPFADPSQIPTILVSKLAKQHVTVSLSGDGGDELFGGYDRYTWFKKLNQIPFLIRKPLANLINAFTPNQWNKVYKLGQPFLPKDFNIRMPADKIFKFGTVLTKSSAFEIYEQLISNWKNPEEIVIGSVNSLKTYDLWEQLSDFNSDVQRMMVIDTLTYLPGDILCKLDRAAMSVSLETRVPFLDHRVVEFAWQLPMNYKIRDGQSKWILRKLLYKYVPKELIERPKMGFAVPIDSWIRGPLKEWAEDLLNEKQLTEQGYLNPIPIRLKWKEHLSGKKNWQYPLWNVLMFQSWLTRQIK